MDIITERKAGYIILKLIGRFDAITSNALEEKIMHMIESGEIKLVADCTNLDYASSSALRVFLLTLKTLKQKNGQLKLFGLQPQIREVFDISGFLDLFESYNNQEQAVGSES